MAKLTDTHIVILSAAAQRDDGAVLPLPKSLKIKGTAAIRTLDSLLKKGLLEERPAARGAEAWRQTGDGPDRMLVITDTGLKAIDAGPEEGTKPPVKAGGNQPRTRRRATGSRHKAQEAKPSVRKGTKQALLIDLLRRKAGATIDEIVEATGWQAHSVRGAISGALKKKLELTVTSEMREGRGRVYRITGAA